jgi:acetyl-CoA synthetase
VDAADSVSFLAEDEECRVVVCLLEGVPDPRRLEEAIARAAERGKATVVCKMARGAQGAATAASHTGSLAGSHDAYRTMVERAGGVFVEDFDQVLEVAQFFAKMPPPQADGAAIIATSGGAAVLCADAAEDSGVPLPQPTSDVRGVLEARIPEFGAARNPCDVTAQVLNDREALIDCVNAMLGQADYGALVVPHPMAYPFSVPRIGLFDRLAGEVGKPIALVWNSGWLEGPGAWEAETAQNVALFRSTRVCFETLAAWARWHRRLVVERERPRLTKPDAEVAGRIAAATGAVTEREAKAILGGYGVPVIEERRATTAAEAGEAAAWLGFPLAMKIDSPDLPHKTEAGGIALGLDSVEAVSAEFEAMMARVQGFAPEARIEGVLLQRMAPKGLEMVVGARFDEAYGPLVVVGLSGVMVELMKDTVVAPAPVTPREAEDMLRRLRGASALSGFRDLPAVDVAKLAEVVARVSEFAADAGEALAELDVNPLICRGSDLVAVDALIIPKGG